MMTLMQSPGDTCRQASVAYTFLNDLKALVPPPSPSGEPECAFRPEKESREDMSQKETAAQAVNEMPLWPSLKKIRTTTGKNAVWKEEIEQALNYRSVFISAVMLSMMAFGFIMTF